MRSVHEHSFALFHNKRCQKLLMSVDGGYFGHLLCNAVSELFLVKDFVIQNGVNFGSKYVFKCLDDECTGSVADDMKSFRASRQESIMILETWEQVVEEIAAEIGIAEGSPAWEIVKAGPLRILKDARTRLLRSPSVVDSQDHPCRTWTPSFRPNLRSVFSYVSDESDELEA
eukprot:scaffold1557_cov246-Pinguiococcus_pyrenoidosus.AAC.27